MHSRNYSLYCAKYSDAVEGEVDDETKIETLIFFIKTLLNLQPEEPEQINSIIIELSTRICAHEERISIISEEIQQITEYLMNYLITQYENKQILQHIFIILINVLTHIPNIIISLIYEDFIIFIVELVVSSQTINRNLCLYLHFLSLLFQYLAQDLSNENDDFKRFFFDVMNTKGLLQSILSIFTSTDNEMIEDLVIDFYENVFSCFHQYFEDKCFLFEVFDFVIKNNWTNCFEKLSNLLVSIVDIDPELLFKNFPSFHIDFFLEHFNQLTEETQNNILITMRLILKNTSLDIMDYFDFHEFHSYISTKEDNESLLLNELLLLQQFLLEYGFSQDLFSNEIIEELISLTSSSKPFNIVKESVKLTLLLTCTMPISLLSHFLSRFHIIKQMIIYSEMCDNEINELLDNSLHRINEFYQQKAKYQFLEIHEDIELDESLLHATLLELDSLVS